MSKEHTIRIHEGRIAFVYDDDLAPLVEDADMKVCRASHVEPHPSKPGWLADMRPSGGPVLGFVPSSSPGYVEQKAESGESFELIGSLLEPFPTRAAALAAERRWLEKEKGL